MTATAPPFGPPPSALRRPLAAAGLLTALLGAVLGLLLAVAAPASAHAALTGSDPQDGAVVATAPTQITLTFSEQVALGTDSIRVLDPSGKRADTKAAPRDLHSGSTVKYGVALRDGLGNGTYTVAWQAVSADSHPVSGAFTFSIGAPSETSVALPDNEAGAGSSARSTTSRATPRTPGSSCSRAVPPSFWPAGSAARVRVRCNVWSYAAG